FRRAPPVAYVSGSMGTLIGADLLNLRQFWRLGAPMVSIGGAGTFDGVFLTGILAGLLALAWSESPDRRAVVLSQRSRRRSASPEASGDQVAFAASGRG